MLPLSLFWAGSCPSSEKKDNTFHPQWSVLNDPEDNLDPTRCTITKSGLGCIRFQPAARQKCLNPDSSGLEPKGNIIQTPSEVINVVLTPNVYGSLTSENFPKTMQAGIKYQYYDPVKGGMPLEFLEEWLAIDPIDLKDITLIISAGIEGRLGVSTPLENALKDKKQQGAIQDYLILRTQDAIMTHNEYTKEGKKVFTFIHTAG